MGRYWHTVLPFLVAACISYATVQDVSIVSVLTSDSLNVYDYQLDEHLISLSGFDGSATGNLNWKLTQLQNLLNGIYSSVEGFEDSFTQTTRKHWLNVHDEDSKTNIIAAINKSIDTNQYYLAAILDELNIGIDSSLSNLVFYVTNSPPDILSSSWFTKDGDSYFFSTNNAIVDSIQPTIDAAVETNNLNAFEAPDDVWNGFDDDDKPGSKDKFMVSFGINKRFNFMSHLTNTIFEGPEMKNFNEDTPSTLSRLFDSFQDEFSSLNDDNGSFEIVYNTLSVPGLHTPVSGTKSIKIYSSDVNDNSFVAILQMFIDVNELCIGFFGSILLVRRVLKRMP